jgi:hypothetical protein
MYTQEERNSVGSVTRHDVFLQFEDEKLFHWQVTKPPSPSGFSRAMEGPCDRYWECLHSMTPLGHDAVRSCSWNRPVGC